MHAGGVFVCDDAALLRDGHFGPGQAQTAWTAVN